jgi:SPP1 family predicted phage head-tail adaptor
MSLDRKITIYQPVLIKSASGMEDTQYSLVTFPEVYSELKFGKGTEDQEGKQVVAKNTHLFKIRYRTDLREDFIILFEGQYFDILGIQEQGRRKHLVITAEAKDNDRNITIHTP